MPLPHGFKAKANRMAVELRGQMGLRPIDPICPWDICRHFDITVLKISELDLEGEYAAAKHFLGPGSQKLSAFTMPVGWRRTIVHNDRHVPARQRSNISHELAHCFLGHRMAPPLTENGDRARHSGQEEEATFLGAAILIPNEAAVYIIKTSMTESAATARYGVSLDMLRFRIKLSGASIMASRSAAKAR